MRISLSLLITVSFVLFSGCGDDDGSSGTDSGPGRRDSGSPGVDSGTPGVDSGPMPMVDSGTPGVDSGPAPGVDSGPPGMGACTNATDMAWSMSHDSEMVVGDCAEGCLGGDDCTRMCLVDMGMTNPCAVCFGHVVGCTAMMCTFECLGGGDSPECGMCRDMMGCTAAFEMCSGLMD